MENHKTSSKNMGIFQKMIRKILNNLLLYLLKIVLGIRNKTGLICYNIARKIVLKTYMLFHQDSKFKLVIIKVLKHFPRLDRIIRNLIDGKPLFSSQNTIIHFKQNVNNSVETSPQYRQLSPRAKEIYKQLKKAIEDKKSGGDK